MLTLVTYIDGKDGRCYAMLFEPLTWVVYQCEEIEAADFLTASYPNRYRRYTPTLPAAIDWYKRSNRDMPTVMWVIDSRI